MSARYRQVKLDKEMHIVKETLEKIDSKASTYPLEAKCPTCGRSGFYSSMHYEKHVGTCTGDGRRAGTYRRRTRK